MKLRELCESYGDVVNKISSELTHKNYDAKHLLFDVALLRSCINIIKNNFTLDEIPKNILKTVLGIGEDANNDYGETKKFLVNLKDSKINDKEFTNKFDAELRLVQSMWDNASSQPAKDALIRALNLQVSHLFDELKTTISKMNEQS